MFLYNLPLVKNFSFLFIHRNLLCCYLTFFNYHTPHSQHDSSSTYFWRQLNFISIYLLCCITSIRYDFLYFKHTIVISYAKKAARFEISKAALLMIQFFWDITVCHWVSSSRHFEGTNIFWTITHYSPSDTVWQARRLELTQNIVCTCRCHRILLT